MKPTLTVDTSSRRSPASSPVHIESANVAQRSPTRMDNSNVGAFSPTRPDIAAKASPSIASPALRVRNIQSAGRMYGIGDRFVDRVLRTAPHPVYSSFGEGSRRVFGNLSPLELPKSQIQMEDLFGFVEDDNHFNDLRDLGFGERPYTGEQLRWTDTLEIPTPDDCEANSGVEEPMTVISVNTSMFADMSVEGMISYIDKKDTISGLNTFLHVTPRYNLESISKMNFYDLVVLSKPGDPSPGYVWASRTVARKDSRLLSPHQLFTISKVGLIFPALHDGDTNGIIKIDDFLRFNNYFYTMYSPRSLTRLSTFYNFHF